MMANIRTNASDLVESKMNVILASILPNLTKYKWRHLVARFRTNANL